ncbi:MAG: hypothetical protein PHC51_08675 [bacterium]|nr:hypothetical protein [bacterium]
MSSRKKSLSKIARDADLSHWLGEGSAGQETLFLHFDPYLYAADKHLVSHMNRLSFASEEHDDLPQATLWLADGLPIFWHLPLLCRSYNVTVVSDDDDDILNAATTFFEAEQIGFEEIFKNFTSAVRLLVYMQSCWESRGDFVAVVRAAIQCLEEDGEAVFILPAWGDREDALQVCWADGEYTPLADILAGSVFRLPAPDGVKSASLADIAALPDLGARAFVDTHRAFWGRNIARGKGAVRGREVISQQCYARLLEEDISPYLFDEHRDKRWVVVLNWVCP